MFNYTHCPICQNGNFSKVITCKDHTVSQKDFTIVSCLNCNFKFTNPIPDIDKLGEYYKSEDYISHSNTKKGLVSSLYHIVRNYTLKKKLKLIRTHVSRGTILDYGCGTGMFLKVCADAGWKAYGIEPDAGARNIGTGLGLSLAANKSELTEVKEGVLDVITLWHVLEHVTDLKDALNYFWKTLNKDGTLIIAVPNHKSYDAKHYKEHWAAYDVPRHLYHFEKNTMLRLLEDNDFALKEIKPMLFDSFYVSMLSEKYKTGSINYFKALLTGLKSNLSANTNGEYSSLIYVFNKK